MDIKSDAVNIRPYRSGDDDAMYYICRETGPRDDAGNLVYTHPRLLGEVYVGPYIALEPELAFVAADHDVAGYVIGVRDTSEFEEKCERQWWPMKREQYPEGEFPAPAPEHRLLRMIRQPDVTPTWLAEQYPSHLHIDLLPRLQGRGMGGALMARLLDALRAAGSPGVHLGVGAANTGAIGFYDHLGFTTVSRTESGLIMALAL